MGGGDISLGVTSLVMGGGVTSMGKKGSKGLIKPESRSAPILQANRPVWSQQKGVDEG